LGGTYYLVQPKGGGTIPDNGVPTGTLSYQAVTRVTIPPYSAAILLNEIP
jgi:hypothetical protein